MVVTVLLELKILKSEVSVTLLKMMVWVAFTKTAKKPVYSLYFKARCLVQEVTNCPVILDITCPKKMKEKIFQSKFLKILMINNDYKYSNLIIYNYYFSYIF